MVIDGAEIKFSLHVWPKAQASFCRNARIAGWSQGKRNRKQNLDTPEREEENQSLESIATGA